MDFKNFSNDQKWKNIQKIAKMGDPENCVIFLNDQKFRKSQKWDIQKTASISPTRKTGRSKKIFHSIFQKNLPPKIFSTKNFL